MIKIPNDIFKLNLSGTALKLYVYILSVQRGGKLTVKYETIRQRINVASDATVSSALQELINTGLIVRTHRFTSKDLYAANRYTVRQFASESGYFLVDASDVMLLQRSSVIVYLYYLKCASTRQKQPVSVLRYIDMPLLTKTQPTAFPTEAEIIKNCSLCAKTVRKTITCLRRIQAIVKKWSGCTRTAFTVQKPVVSVGEMNNKNIDINSNDEKTESKLPAISSGFKAVKTLFLRLAEKTVELFINPVVLEITKRKLNREI